MTDDNKNSTSRFDTVLAYAGAALIILSIVALFGVLIAGAMGVSGDTFASGFWLVLAFFPRVGLPAGFLLIVIVVVTSGVKRRRQTRSPNAR